MVRSKLLVRSEICEVLAESNDIKPDTSSKSFQPWMEDLRQSVIYQNSQQFQSRLLAFPERGSPPVLSRWQPALEVQIAKFLLAIN